MKKQDEDRLWIKASACFGGIAVGAMLIQLIRQWSDRFNTVAKL